VPYFEANITINQDQNAKVFLTCRSDKGVKKTWITCLAKLAILKKRLLGRELHIYPSVSPTLRRLTQEDLKFKASLGYMVRPCL
jgi:hypothetical protein